MTFFQNVFTSEFRGSFPVADRSLTPHFNCPRNEGRGDEIVFAWNEGPYDLSGNDADGNSTDTLVINLAMNVNDYHDWATVSLNIAGATPAATTAEEIVEIINGNDSFKGWFTAKVEKFDSGASRVSIRQNQPVPRFRFYIVNGRAEEKLRFNAKAGVAELTTYFHRHIVWINFDANEREIWSDGTNILIELDPSASGGASAVDTAIIDNAVDKSGKTLGLDSSNTREDWELMAAQSGFFEFTKGPSGGAVSTTDTEIIYHAGSKVGDFAQKIVTQFDAGGAIVAKFILPHTLASSDLITPP